MTTLVTRTEIAEEAPVPEPSLAAMATACAEYVQEHDWARNAFEVDSDLAALCNPDSGTVGAVCAMGAINRVFDTASVEDTDYDTNTPRGRLMVALARLLDPSAATCVAGDTITSWNDLGTYDLASGKFVATSKAAVVATFRRLANTLAREERVGRLTR